MPRPSLKPRILATGADHFYKALQVSKHAACLKNHTRQQHPFELAITAAQVGGILKRKMETGGLKTVFALESDCPGLDPDSSPY